MSSAETPDDEEPPEFNFDRWLKQVSAMLAVIFVVGAAIVYLRPASEGRTEAQQRETLEFICSGKTLRPSSDFEECKTLR